MSSTSTFEDFIRFINTHNNNNNVQPVQPVQPNIQTKEVPQPYKKSVYGNDTFIYVMCTFL